MDFKSDAVFEAGGLRLQLVVSGDLRRLAGQLLPAEDAPMPWEGAARASALALRVVAGTGPQLVQRLAEVLRLALMEQSSARNPGFGQAAFDLGANLDALVAMPNVDLMGRPAQDAEPAA